MSTNEAVVTYEFKPYQLGPTGEHCCPKCQNSMQNAIPEGSPHLRRCASCKTVFEANPFAPVQYFADIQRGMVENGFALVSANNYRTGGPFEYDIPVKHACDTYMDFHVRGKAIILALRYSECVYDDNWGIHS